MQERNRDAVAESGLVGTIGEGEDELNGGSSIGIDTPSWVKWAAGEKLPYNTGPSLVLCDDGEAWDEGKGGRLKTEGIRFVLYGRNQHNIAKIKK